MAGVFISEPEQLNVFARTLKMPSIPRDQGSLTPSAKLVISVLAVVLTIHVPFNELRAASNPEPTTLDAPSQIISAPDNQRVVSDLTSHYQFVSTTVIGAGTAPFGQADSSAVRSTIRKGDVLEFRVTSVFNADVDAGPQLEVSSIVSYQLDEDRWSLIGVQTEGTRSVVSSRASSDTTENC